LKVPISRIHLTEDELNSVTIPLKKGWLVQGKEVDDFQNKWTKFNSVKYAIAVNSCTSALQLALVSIGFKKGDKALVPAFTWVSTANVVENLGGEVVFSDIDLETFNLDQRQGLEVINNSIKALLPVHLFGLPCEMAKIVSLSKKYSCRVIEDAACGLGAELNGNPVGSFGDIGCFSFHPRKSITTGEGGMLTTNEKDLAQKLKMLRDNGAFISESQRLQGAKPYLLADHLISGYNMRMTDLQAALGSAQMGRVKEIIDERRQLAKIYNHAFEDIEWLRTPTFKTQNKINGFQSYPCLFQPLELRLKNVKRINLLRNEFMDKLNELGVSTRPATHAVHMLSYYREKYKLKPEDFPNAFIADQCSVSLPLFHGISEIEQHHVITSVKHVFSKMKL
jgi:dTDP-4-amino-4,6-dideoxygalactose transaminase